MNTNIATIDIEGDKIPEVFKPFLKSRMSEDEVICFAAMQNAPRKYLQNLMRQQLKKSFISVLLKVAWFFIVPALALSFVSLWWLLLALPGLLSLLIYVRVRCRVMKNMVEDCNGLFVITDKYARYLSYGDSSLGGTFSDGVNGKPFDSMITSSEFKIAPDLLVSCHENPDGTSMIDFDRKYLVKGLVQSGQSAWQYVTSGKEALSVLESVKVLA